MTGTDPNTDSADGALAAATADDPATGLRAVRSLRVLADRLETLQVGRARELGWSWQDIADALGVSRQAVHQKHHRKG
ncbi:helix-turn-helix domain-containing protein [Cellulomonas sp. IC4_254]|uniref:helix-turn-helix domain-containing protein n=1 Tax=Cellulomonas sp. IC4_254 TaxID=2714040 RepID=UPI0014223AC9|nr:helix-turn-helix domain-containing protein [Cellulomonas sp. IC4_254]NHT18433.1 RNA polymerase subunit sigma-70 [Cellulomonas sp. IC4_254]